MLFDLERAGNELDVEVREALVKMFARSSGPTM